jgi:hypothetical protein
MRDNPRSEQIGVQYFHIPTIPEQFISTRCESAIMSKATIEEAEKLFHGALDDIESAEYKLRTGIQLMEILKYQEDELLTIVEENCEGGDREIFEELRDLGYIE